jgi:hypothetical protein
MLSKVEEPVRKQGILIAVRSMLGTGLPSTSEASGPEPKAAVYARVGRLANESPSAENQD